ncbi:MAG: nucleoside hydrolase [Thermoguttaceae bacterium]
MRSVMPVCTLFVLLAIGPGTTHGEDQAMTPRPGDRKVPVIHCTDLYHPPADPDDHFDLATMYSIPEVDLKAVVLDYGPRQQTHPGSIPVSQLNALTGRSVPCAIGLSKNLANPGDKVAEDKPEFQKAVALIHQVLRESKEPVSITIVGSCRDVAAAFNREPELFRAKVGKLMIFAGEADENQQQYKKHPREWNVWMERNGYVCLQRSGLPVYWVPCFDGGRDKNNGHASYWVPRQADLLARCGPELLSFFGYALLCDKKNPLNLGDPIQFVSKPLDEASRAKVLSGPRELWCTAVFLALVGRDVFRDGQSWAVGPTGSRPGVQPVFGFVQRDVTALDDAAIRYGKTETSKKIMCFEIFDREHYAEAMTAATAQILAGFLPVRPSGNYNGGR